MEPDPHLDELMRRTRLPESYLPAAMAGPQKPWVRVCASLIIGIFVLSAVSGICLTYGPGA